MSSRVRPQTGNEYPEPTYLKQVQVKPGPKAREDRERIRHNVVSSAFSDDLLKAFDIIRRSFGPVVPTRSAMIAHIVEQFVMANKRRDLPGTVPLRRHG